ncbi:MAG: M23 family metallopeptidase, partial [Chloroflexota bacterium]|nr:M23 family metallopeptidase [Chloroflexota bacterium]
TEAIGSDPNDFSGRNYTPYSNRNLGIICRINNGYSPGGTIPNSSQYADFARRCANFVANTAGCKIWIIGNEMNYAIERPPLFVRSLGPAVPPMPQEDKPASRSSLPANSPLAGVTRTLQGFLNTISGKSTATGETPAPATAARASTPFSPDDPFGHGLPQRFNALHRSERTVEARGAAFENTELITPDLYVRCYRLCRDAIHAIPGHANDQVLVGPVAPWNNQTSYPGNLNGDWVQYFRDILTLLGSNGCDGFALHTYTHQADPNLITDESTMDPPFQNRRFQFRAYQDFMTAVPTTMRQLPAYITETDEDVAWLDQNIGWVQRAYGEINFWNQQPNNQQIRAMILYRWPNLDRWGIEGKGGVIEDFRSAMQNDYRWRASTVAPPNPTGFRTGQVVETRDSVNIRRTPGYTGKPAGDVLQSATTGSRLTVLSDVARTVDNLVWWNVQTGTGVNGWAAQFGPTGAPLLVARAEVTPPGGTGVFAVGDRVRTADVVRMRRSPGYTNKPSNDVIADIPIDSVFTVTGGPTGSDGLTWWQVRGANRSGATVEGWMAQIAPDGKTLLVRDTTPVETGTFAVGDAVSTRDAVRVRLTPGYVGKPDSDIIAGLPTGTRGVVVSPLRRADNLIWWQVEATGPAGNLVRGWIAEVAPNDAVLLERAAGSTTPVPAGDFALGELVVAVDAVRIRRSPGFANKTNEDVLGEFAARTTLNLLEGPRNVDNLTWWRAGGIASTGNPLGGWVAQRAPGGAALVDRAAKLPGTNIPDRAAAQYLGVPFQGRFGIAQLWGENPQIYSAINYDGVPLRGHNGIDFLTPIGTNLLAMEEGVVAETVLNDPNGFGNYVKLRHRWGESLYAHMDSLAVQPGQSVGRGTLIGRSGNTGFSSGPHLHFAIRIDPYRRTDGWGGYTDPLPYLNPNDFFLPAQVQGAAQGATQSRSANNFTDEALLRAPGYAPDRPGLVRP